VNSSDLPPPKAILYDWDNTLVDTWPVIHGAMNGLFRKMEMPEWTLAETRNRVRHSMRDSFPVMFGDRWEEARDIFYAEFEAIHMQALVAAPGAASFLHAVHTKGIPQAVISNKQGRFLRKEAAHLDWDVYFHALVGAGDAARDKPSPEPVSMALQGLRDAGGDLQPGPDIYFIGDSGVDMQIAHATGLTPILIHADPDLDGEYADCRPARIFGHLDALHAFLATDRSYI
jgi:phosphoglycolate phosphatase|tara:strand:- start:291 stop:980 length:690 start_codon:yes stop_codon:yes gene_type:complete